MLSYMNDVYRNKSSLHIKGWGNPKENLRPEKVTYEQVKNADFIWLHCGFGELKHSTDDFFRFTFFRHPLERAMSAYCYLRNPEVLTDQELAQTPEHVVKLLRAIEHMSYEDFVLSEKHKPWSQANYRYYLTRNEHVENRFSKVISSVFPTVSRNTDLKRVCSLMEKNFHFIGLTAHLSEDMETLRRTCFPEHKTSFGETRINISKKPDVDLTLSRKALKAFNDLFAEEFAIYRYAAKIRKKKIAELNNR